MLKKKQMDRWKILRILGIQTRDEIFFFYEGKMNMLKFNFVATYKYVSGKSFSIIIVPD